MCSCSGRNIATLEPEANLLLVKNNKVISQVWNCGVEHHNDPYSASQNCVHLLRCLVLVFGEICFMDYSVLHSQSIFAVLLIVCSELFTDKCRKQLVLFYVIKKLKMWLGKKFRMNRNQSCLSPHLASPMNTSEQQLILHPSLALQLTKIINQI